MNDPILLVEVVSPGSEARDRVEKDRLYRRLPTLQHYVFVARDTAVIDVFDRVQDGWIARRAEGLEATVESPALDCVLAASEVYRDVL